MRSYSIVKTGGNTVPWLTQKCLELINAKCVLLFSGAQKETLQSYTTSYNTNPVASLFDAVVYMISNVIHLMHDLS